MELLLFFLNISWKILLIWIIFKLIGLWREKRSEWWESLTETVGLAMSAFGAFIRRHSLNCLRKEKEKESVERKSFDEIAAVSAYNEYLRGERDKCLTFEEFCRKMEACETLRLD